MKSGGHYKKHPGLKAAAKKLGVTYSHLRKVVLGRRDSYPLYTRYLDLVSKEKPKEAPLPTSQK